MSQLRAVTVLAVIISAAVARPVPPDSWVAFSNQRVVSPSGMRYVVVKKAGRGITYELCQRAAGAAAMTAAAVSSTEKEPKVSIERDPADRLVASGKVAQLPYRIFVPDGFDGFLLFENYGGIGHGQSVIWIDGAGQEAVSLKLTDIFGVVPEQATRTVSSIWWNEAVWIDEAAGSIVVVAVGDEVRTIALADGAVATPDRDRILSWIATGSTAARSAALELVGRGEKSLLDAAAPIAVRLFHDDGEPMALRLRAAVMLSQAGAPVAAEPLFQAARAEGQPEELRRYAVANLTCVLGDKALPVLRELMRGKAGALWGDCMQSFVRHGEAAVPTLIAMLGEAGESADYRGGAAHALGKIKSERALDALLEATATAEDYVANAACNAAIATGGEGLTERLIAVLAAGSTQDGRIAMYLTKHPTRAALPAIEAGLGRDGDRHHRRRLEQAKAACELAPEVVK
ncbi:MAG: HEAT repeat domain-containing protein [Planctomycetes bacterium]|nr:HEAT repeat domain-containing protein [Planctomycetota bacterium]